MDMTFDSLATFLGWCSLINMAVLLLSTLALITFRQPVTSLHSKLFGLNEQDLGRAYFQYLAQYKIVIIVFNLTPYLALRVMQ